VGEARWRRARQAFDGFRLDDAGTLASMREVYRATGELVDPHTAIAVAAAKQAGGDPGVPVVALATAHPAKFPDAVERATGVRPALPERLAALFERPERVHVLPSALDALQAFIRARGAVRGAA